MAKNDDDRFFVRTLIDLARQFRLKTVAEWVRDEATAVMLKEMGVDYLQGDLTGSPAAALGDARAPGYSAA